MHAAAVVDDVVVVHGERTLTDLDHSRLTKLAGHRLPPVLDDLLAQADITSSRTWPGEAPTPCARGERVGARTRRRQVVTLCSPQDAEPAAGFISVLSPVGISLLGLREGDVARWQTPHGEECAAVIECIQFQPEAAGDYHT